MIKEIFAYNNVYLRPKHSSLNSRDDADTSVELCGYTFKIPVVAANMIDVISFENAKILSQNGYFYIMHRFEGSTKKFIPYARDNKLPLISISIGVNDNSKNDFDYANQLVKVDFVCIDVAHADCNKVEKMIDYIRQSFEGCLHKPKIIVGNIATDEGYKFLVGCGADVIKCGIGGGQICTTRYQTGFHLPTAYSVYECVQTGLNVPIIADGGVQCPGDIVKALVLGAKMVMCGGLFASCIDSAAKIIGGKKVYRGSTSYEAKGQRKHIEGKQLELDRGITYMERMEEIRQALCSSISYAGGKNLSAFKSVEWSLL